jgi:ubiquinone biosynthesis protein
LRVNRAEVTMDASLAYLMPDIDYFAMIREYERGARQRELRRRMSHDDWPRRLAQVFQVVDSFDDLGERVYFDAEWVRRRATMYVAGAGKASLAVAAMFRPLVHLLTAAIVALPLVYAYQHGRLVGAASWLGLTAVLDDMPVISPGALVICLAVLLYVRLGIARLRRTLREPDLQVNR